MASIGAQLRDRTALGSPLTSGALTVFPLLALAPSRVRCLLFDVAAEQGLVEVTEVSAGGSVPSLRVKNRAPMPVLILEGQELAGGKQNRVVNVSILVAAGSEMELPVSCIERGRWAARSRTFKSDYTVAPSVRSVLRASVSRNVSLGRGPASDQGAVWGSVDMTLSRSGTFSGTSSLSESYAARFEDLRQEVEAFPPRPEQVGFLVAVRGRPVGLELFPDPEAYARVHAKALAAYAFAAACEAPATRLGDTAQFLAALDAIEPARTPSTGLGTDCRAETGDVSLAALELEGELVHAAVLAREIGG